MLTSCVAPAAFTCGTISDRTGQFRAGSLKPRSRPAGGSSTGFLAELSASPASTAVLGRVK